MLPKVKKLAFWLICYRQDINPRSHPITTTNLEFHFICNPPTPQHMGKI